MVLDLCVLTRRGPSCRSLPLWISPDNSICRFELPSAPDPYPEFDVWRSGEKNFVRGSMLFIWATPFLEQALSWENSIGNSCFMKLGPELRLSQHDAALEGMCRPQINALHVVPKNTSIPHFIYILLNNVPTTSFVSLLVSFTTAAMLLNSGIPASPMTSYTKLSLVVTTAPSARSLCSAIPISPLLQLLTPSAII